MQQNAIPALPVTPAMPQTVKQLRKKAPEYIRSIIEDSDVIKEICSLEEVNNEDINVLGGGMLSANYLVQTKKEWLVIKLRMAGITAEATSLKAWKKVGANVVTVKKLGIVPVTRDTKREIKYLILEAARDKKGNLAQTCEEYVEIYSGQTKAIGKQLGKELALMHKAKTSRTFGEFSDMWGANHSPYKTWNAYLLGYIDVHYRHLRNLGYTKLQIENIKAGIESIKFAKKGVFCHGDYSLRNTMVESQKPLRTIGFDPNPLVGEPSWDLALFFNNYEYAKKCAEKVTSKGAKTKLQMHKDCLDGVLLGYKEKSRYKNDIGIVTSQFIQTLFLLEIEENKAKKSNKDPDKTVDVLVRREVLLEKAKQLVEFAHKKAFHNI